MVILKACWAQAALKPAEEEAESEGESTDLKVEDELHTSNEPANRHAHMAGEGNIPQDERGWQP